MTLPDRPQRFTISVVSHGHGAMLAALLDDIVRLRPAGADDIIVTLNIPEAPGFDRNRWGTALRWIDNPAPKGFAANHNAALRGAQQPYLAVVNPDIRLHDDAFAALARRLAGQPGIAAPLVTDSQSHKQDSARQLPTPMALARRAVRRLAGTGPAPPVATPDWIAGMFYIIDRPVWEALNGFDEGYFLYCEDVDLCLRARLAGFHLRYETDILVLHDAQRDSHRSMRHLSWHLTSLARLWRSPAYRAYRAMAG
jgi:GT2 family glycosyltransferase